MREAIRRREFEVIAIDRRLPGLAPHLSHNSAGRGQLRSRVEDRRIDLVRADRGACAFERVAMYELLDGDELVEPLDDVLGACHDLRLLGSLSLFRGRDRHVHGVRRCAEQFGDPTWTEPTSAHLLNGLSLTFGLAPELDRQQPHDFFDRLHYLVLFR